MQTPLLVSLAKTPSYGKSSIIRKTTCKLGKSSNERQGSTWSGFLHCGGRPGDRFLRVCAINSDAMKENPKRLIRVCPLESLHLLTGVPIQLLSNLFSLPVSLLAFEISTDNLIFS